ncbi:MAG: nucleotidyltransferase domain-containing protein [Verrucomicrobiales bacterium]|jgi:predicted nucleotidyltransferase|nr:nucleotidyltransferase domain-containing protein [Verrucomicrobiales bacterium]MBP9225998.1 nucleotidyltransferase domain-containing protein [Verrucomicrobiales bacterium]HQZ30147.1 nucleotidyltransferase domain-containing protein [Verrucomicrobiales bacterium]
MKDAHGLKAATIARIVEVLRSFPEMERAMLFGSRAKGTHEPGSDIDLALSGEGLDWRALGRIDDALDDLLLPYRFSLITLDERTDEDVAAHVRRVGSLFYERDLMVRA